MLLSYHFCREYSTPFVSDMGFVSDEYQNIIIFPTRLVVNIPTPS